MTEQGAAGSSIIVPDRPGLGMHNKTGSAVPGAPTGAGAAGSVNPDPPGRPDAARNDTARAPARGSLCRPLSRRPLVRWTLVIAVVLGLSTWTPHGVGVVSRVLFLVLLMTVAIGGTSQDGWMLMNKAIQSRTGVVAIAGVAAFGLFLLLVLQVLLRGPLAGEDIAVAQGAVRVRHDWVYSLAQLFATAGHWAIQSALLLVVAGGLWVRRRQISALVIAALSLGLLAVVVGSAKLAFGRARPPLNVSALHAGGDSFPSGHVAAAVVVGGVLAWLLGQGQPRWVRRLLWAVAALWALVIGLSRLYIDVHWLTDVLAGWAIGITLLCAVHLSYRWFSRYDARLEQALHSVPGPRFAHRPAAAPREWAASSHSAT